MRDLKKRELNTEWMHISQDCGKLRSILDAVVTELNEEAEEMEKMKKERGRKERRGSEYQIRLTYSVLNLVAPLQVLSITNDRNIEQQSKDPLLLSLPPKL